MNQTCRVLADGPLPAATTSAAADWIEWVDWDSWSEKEDPSIAGIYTLGHPIVDGRLLDLIPNTRVISNYGVGVDHIRLDDARMRGIPVGNTPNVLNGATADMGMCLMLATARRLGEAERYARGADFTEYRPGMFLGQEIHGAQLGIIGMGRIGFEVAKRACAFEMQVCYHNRTQRPDCEKQLDLTYLSLNELLQTSDFVMLCVPLTEATTSLIGPSELALMKPTSILVNIARGAVVDTDALTDALQRKQIFAAGLDVTEPEPLPRGHPLLDLPNVVVAPHLGSATLQTRQKMSELSVENLQRGLEGRELVCRAD